MDKIIVLKVDDASPIVMMKKNGLFTPMNDQEWKRRIHHYSYLHDAAKVKMQRKKLKKMNIVCKAKATSSLPNAPGQCILRQTGFGTQRDLPKQEDLRRGTQAILSLAELFPDPAVGYTMAATILCGMRARALREAEPDFHPVMAISCPDRLTPLFSKIALSIVPRKKWKGKNCMVKRNPVLDLEAYSTNICNFSCVKVKRGKARSVPLPFPYVDTVALVIGTRASGQWNQMVPHLQDAAVILLNCKLPGGWGVKKVPSYAIAQYDPELAKAIEDSAPYMAALLRWWWMAEDPSDWAGSVIQAARNVLGKPDGRYATVEFDPWYLRQAVYHRVILSFFDDAERHGWLTPEEAEFHRQAVADVFDPAPPTPTAPRRAEDPEVFLSTMRKLVAEYPDHIAGVDEAYHANKKQFAAAWRDIGQVRHLVVLESVWKAAYTKAIRADKSIDASFLERKDWALELQKVLSNKGVIKAASAGYRYRYDLLANGTRDQTYVLAIPAKLLDP